VIRITLSLFEPGREMRTVFFSCPVSDRCTGEQNHRNKGEVCMNVEFMREGIDLPVTELESIIPKLRSIIASGGRKELRDEMREDTFRLMEILDKRKRAA
jgi:hypothetical protein